MSEYYIALTHIKSGHFGTDDIEIIENACKIASNVDIMLEVKKNAEKTDVIGYEIEVLELIKGEKK